MLVSTVMTRLNLPIGPARTVRRPISYPSVFIRQRTLRALIGTPDLMDSDALHMCAVTSASLRFQQGGE
jgi:hypothetical protein